jgi:hypothetical protein
MNSATGKRIERLVAKENYGERWGTFHGWSGYLEIWTNRNEPALATGSEGHRQRRTRLTEGNLL